MKWGVHIPHLGREVSGEVIASFAQDVEAMGVHSVWVSDHVCWPAHIESKYPYTADGSFPANSSIGWLEPISTLLFIAGCTTRVRLGTTVLILPYRAPVVTAKQLATLDVVSNGRLILGAGVGWMAEEAEVLGMPWDNRGKRSDEQLAIFEQLFYQSEASFDGRYYSFPTVHFEPKPVQSKVPVWIGGSSPAAFARTAKFGTGFHAAFQPRDVLVEEWAAVRREAEKLGRDPGELTFSVRLYLDPASAMDPELAIAGSAQQMIDSVGKFADIGVTHLLLDPVARGGVEARLGAIRDVMTDVAPNTAGGIEP